jgi:hypothetical protein
MKNNKTLSDIACRIWPNTHRRYREICVLAATGQLGGPQMTELDEHISRCESCRKYLESVAQASVQAMSILADRRVSEEDVVVPQGMRARFLSRAAAAGLQIENDLILRPHPIPVPKTLWVAPREQREPDYRREESEPSRARITVLAFLSRAVAASAICLAIGIAGYYGGRHRAVQDHSLPVSSAHSSSAAISPATGDAGSSTRIGELKRRKTAIEAQSREFAEESSESIAEKKALTDKLSSYVERLAQITGQSRSEQQQALQEKQQAKNRIASLQDEVDKLRWQLNATESTLAAQQTQSEELKAKLDRTEADLQKELDVRSAKLEIGDLVAARNLHIIDVYDVDTKGTRQHSFGRVFYIEGKSLVFYVYDLEDPQRLNANVVFRVWGEKSGMKETTHNLGILHNEDSSQDRWTLRFDDPKVLAQINSVFVTVETANKHFNEPHGKKVLYAFFGSPPNHP